VDVRIRDGNLTIRLSRRVVTFGHSVRVTAHLAGWHTNRRVTLYKLVSGVRHVIADGAVGPRGNLAVTLSPKRNVGVSAAWAGDDWYTADTVKRSIPVRVALAAHLTGYYSTSGKYRMYHYTAACPSSHRGCPRFAISVRPNHAGKLATFAIQQATATGWRTVASGTVRLRSTSTAALLLLYRNSSVIGHRFRILATFSKDGDHWGAQTPWRHFKITS
jgi:hypothetical protein